MFNESLCGIVEPLLYCASSTLNTKERKTMENVNKVIPCPGISYARIIQVRYTNEECKEGVVLCELGNKTLSPSGKEFVTWRFDTKGNTYSGNYFYGIFSAAQDFKKR